MDDYQRKVRQKLKDDFQHYASKCLKVRTKSGEILPLALNKAQQYLHSKIEQQRNETKRVRAIIVKGRQQGCSTYIEGRFYWLVTHHRGLRAFILTHDNDATNNLFEMAQRYHEYCHPFVRPTVEASNAKELIFSGIDSGYKLGTAGNKAVGRSSTIQLLHGSEVGYWPNAAEHAKGILQAVPNEAGTEVIIESTANGIGNYFHEQWQLAQKGESEYIPIFLPWYWQEEYKKPAKEPLKLDEIEESYVGLYGLSTEQLNWRRSKIIELSAGGADGLRGFMQEYPSNPVEAFQATGDDSFINPHLVMVARQGKAERHGVLVIGVDPARFGDDRTSIIRRQGRAAFGLESYNKQDTMQVVGIVHRIIKNENPFKVYIDIGGLGAGIYDRLCELGFRDTCVPVNGGTHPLDQVKYLNKRAEMWGEMRAWLDEPPVSIPDSDSLHADLCGVKYRYDSNSRLVLEKKEDMKRRGFRSPDEADALALTFAHPNIALQESRKKQDQNIAKSVMGAFNHIDRLKRDAYS